MNKKLEENECFDEQKYNDQRIRLKNKIDFTHKMIIYGVASFAILSLLLIVFFVVGESIHFFTNWNFFNFLFGKNWNPDSDNSKDASYGAFTTIISTLFILFVSLLFSIPLTIFSSLFICEYMSSKFKKITIGFIRLLAGVPSVIFGLFALTEIGPIFQKMGAPTNQNFLLASIILAFMSLPIMISLSINAIEEIPNSYRYASLALGLSKSYTTFRIVKKSAKSGIISAIIMGIARVVGETMAVIMIAGNSTTGLQFHNGLAAFLFSSVRTLAGTIGLEMLENHGSIHESALYAIGVILFIAIIIINSCALATQTFGNRVSTRSEKVNKHKLKNIETKTSQLSHYDIRKLIWKKTSENKIDKLFSIIRYGLMISSIIITISFTLWIVISVLIKGIIAFATIPPSTANDIGINAVSIVGLFLSTIILVITTLIFACPLSLIVAIYLSEYSHPKSFFCRALNFSINVMASIPSIIFGMFGLSIFIGLFHMPLSILTSGLTLTFLVMPLMIRSIERALTNVDKSQKMSSLALGASKTETIWKIIIPAASKGIITAVILSMARIIGESAPVYLTLGTVARMPVAGFLSAGTTLSVKIYMIFKEGSTVDQLNVAYELAIIVMSTILLLNLSVNKIVSIFEYSNDKLNFKEKWQKRFNDIKNFFKKFKKTNNNKTCK